MAADEQKVEEGVGKVFGARQATPFNIVLEARP